ncbi:hypothetical protein HYO62_07070 [Aerococcaceae bacterium DSM 111022]|nr:hypothetical protein [Aerococcaceae bacterium DSM 111022]
MVTWNVLILLLGVFLLITAMFNRPSVMYLILSAVAFGTYFWIISSNLLLFLVFALGILLIIVELYVPDFGIMGLIGLGAIIYTLWSEYHDFSTLVLVLLAILFTGFITGMIYLKSGRNLVLSPGFVLNEAIQTGQSAEKLQKKADLIGLEGETITDLRPVGKAKINAEYYEVISDEDFINSGTPIKVIKVRGTQIYVRKAGN